MFVGTSWLLFNSQTGADVPTNTSSQHMYIPWISVLLRHSVRKQGLRLIRRPRAENGMQMRCKWEKNRQRKLHGHELKLNPKNDSFEKDRKRLRRVVPVRRSFRCRLGRTFEKPLEDFPLCRRLPFAEPAGHRTRQTQSDHSLHNKHNTHWHHNVDNHNYTQWRI